MKLLPLFILLSVVGCATKNTGVQTEVQTEKVVAVTPPPVNPIDPKANAAFSGEQLRMECINGRRLICGKVLKIVPDGLVIDSGYTDLLRAPLIESWVIPGNVSVSRDSTILELKEPGTPCVGLVFLTDIPKRQKVNNFDYVVMMGYPAGQYVFTPVPNVEKPIRKFSCGLDTAVRLSSQAEENTTLK